MYKTIRLFAICIACAVPTLGMAATCSKANLTSCLDSVCAINVGMNPAARCQLCGTASAGEAATGLKSLSVGASSKNTISANELKNAPSDPGAKYMWATEQCVKKIDGCTADDVSNVYDKLIEQSCKAAGISAEMENLQKAALKTKTLSVCKTEINSCVIDEKRCGANMLACEQNTDFDRHYSFCMTENKGCDQFSDALKTELLVSRDNAVKNADTMLANIIKGYQDARANRLKTATDSCKDNSAMQKCVSTTCNNNMQNKCAPGFEAEISMATLLCKFHETACDRIKK